MINNLIMSFPRKNFSRGHLTCLALYVINLSKGGFVMLRRAGITLMEIIVVLIIIGIAAVFFFPNYTVPTEQARAANVRNNLLAIYSAEKNYKNNNSGNYCVDVAPSPQPACAESGNPNCALDLASINCNLSLNIQDDGTYTYSCTGSTCTAKRTSISSSNTIVLTLNSAINLSGNVNPQCNLTNHWCPP